jgi:hypothetical protein
MRRRIRLLALLVAACGLMTACQSPRAQSGEFPRDGKMASPLKTPDSGLVHDSPGYTQYNPF